MATTLLVRLLSPRWWIAGTTGTTLLLAWTASAQVPTPTRVQMVTASGVALPMVSERVNIEIDGQHATTRTEQVFHNSTGMSVEGQYTLFAGPGARANGFSYWNGEQKIVGEVFEKDTARQVYQRVVNRRRDPGLLEEKSDGEFSFAVFPILPDEKKRVEVTYSRWLSRRNGVIEVIAPAARGDAEISVTIMDTRDLSDFASSTHAIEVKRFESGKILVRAMKAQSAAGQFALQYRVAERPWAVSAYVHRNKGEDGFFALSMAAPAGPHEPGMPKDVTLVIDRSGSMAGEKLKQAREACLNILQRLSEQDRVNVMLFDDRVETLFPAPQAVSTSVRRKAIEYVEMMQDGGGTDLAQALLKALSAQLDGGQPRVVLFFTDGQSEATSVIAAATDDKRDVRVFTLGIGKDINRPLLSRLADLKRGRFTYIREAANIERETAALYGQIESPLIVDFSLEGENATVAGIYPRTLPDLFRNDELWVVGRVRGRGPVEFVLNAKQAGKTVAYRTKVTLTDEMIRPWVGRLWAKARIDDLLDELNLTGANNEMSDEVTELALAYNFVTPYTSFLAIPESEVDAFSAQQLATARERKREIMKRKPGATQLSGAEGASAGSAPANHPSVPSQPLPSEEAGESEERNELAALSRDRRMERGAPRKGGCASCSLGNHDGGRDVGPGGLVILMALIALLRRGRQQTPSRRI